ncbi:MAG: hypothetical protein BWY63_01353 [Chloroflexi bacterium ADurb.Bin360]|nr:MAG: hypothetical protein BWY63_01353 [Chloroflexi bacterium ADurb.Bin360]
MGHIDAGDAQALLNVANLGAHLLAQLGIEVGERLIHQQDLRLHDQRARQSNALLLPARELIRSARFQPGELHQFHHPRYTRLDRGARHVFDIQPIGDVLIEIQVREDSIALEHHGHFPLVGW